jgi:hypothetical protein
VTLLTDASQDDKPSSDADREVRSTTRWWSLRDRFSPDDLQTKINLYRSGATAKQVAEKFEVSMRSVTRLLHQHGLYSAKSAYHTPNPYSRTSHIPVTGARLDGRLTALKVRTNPTFKYIAMTLRITKHRRRASQK